MYSLYVEQRSLNGHGSLSWDLAHHMYARALCGKIAIVADKPKELLAATRKQWMRVYRQALKEQASTFDPRRTMELIGILTRMQSMTFSAKPLDDILEADVTLATIDEFVRVPPVCPTLYVTCQVKQEELHMVTGWMPKNGVVVVYTRPHNARKTVPV